jgi:hypothetical protein
MRFQVQDALLLTFGTLLVVLAAVEIPRVWRQPGASRFEANLARAMPYIGRGGVAAICRAFPSAVLASGALLLALGSGFLASADGASLAGLWTLLATGALVAFACGAALAFSAAIAGRPARVIPPPFRPAPDQDS